MGKMIVLCAKLLLAALALGTTTADDSLVLGVDYYPEQWAFSSMASDLKTIKEDLGATTVRVGEFMWAMLEPSFSPLNDPAFPPTFNFTFLDSVLEACEAAGLGVMLGTPTATMPAWLATAYGEEVLLKGADSTEGYAGTVPSFGGRRQYSFNSDTYLAYASRITQAVAARYASRSVVTHWQVDNEIGHETSDLDFSDNSLRSWRQWLEETRFGAQEDGGVEKMNAAWGTVFWGVTYSAYREVPLPKWTVPGSAKTTSTEFRANLSPGMLLDFRRFRRDRITAFTNVLVGELKSAGVTGVITTNAPGGSWNKALDHNDLFEQMDMPAFDNYPVWGGSTSAPQASTVALTLDTARGWRKTMNYNNDQASSTSNDGTGWMVAEQLIGAQGHDIIGFTPRPQQAVAWSAAALLGHGSTALLFFRFRPALFGQEEFCYGVMEHDGSAGRKYTEAQQVFQMAQDHSDLLLTPITSLDSTTAAAAAAAAASSLTTAATSTNTATTTASTASTASSLKHSLRKSSTATATTARTATTATATGLGLGGLSSVALLYSSDSFFAWQAQPQSTAFDISTEAHRLYHPFWRQGLAPIDVLSLPHLLTQLFDTENTSSTTSVDSSSVKVNTTSSTTVTPEEAAAATLFGRYKVLLLPTPIILPDPLVVAANSNGQGQHNKNQEEGEDSESGAMLVSVLTQYVALGGSLWTSFRSDLKDSDSKIRPAQSRLATLAGVKVAEIESLNDPLSVTLECDATDRDDSTIMTAVTAATATTTDGTATTTTTTASATVFREGLELLSSSSPSSSATANGNGSGGGSSGDDDGGDGASSVEVVWKYTDASFFGGLDYAAVTRRRPLSSSLPLSSSSSSSSVKKAPTTADSMNTRPRGRGSNSGSFGLGEVVYIGAGLDPEALVSLAAQTLDFVGVTERAGVSESTEVEQVLRQDRNGQVWRVAINHGEEGAEASDGTALTPFKVDVSPFV